MHHIITGSFRSLALYVLAFHDQPYPKLELVSTVNANGPHQYIALGPTFGDGSRAIYTTTWEHPPSLSSWLFSSNLELKRTSTVPITATSSYISLPRPYRLLYSAGGPSGEVHAVSSSDGAIRGPRIQQFLFTNDIESADKTRVALRYGSHALEICDGKAFVPVLGTNSIEMYAVEEDGQLSHLSSNVSGKEGAGPRHVLVRDNKLYVVTEHCQFSFCVIGFY